MGSMKNLVPGGMSALKSGITSPRSKRNGSQSPRVGTEAALAAGVDDLYMMDEPAKAPTLEDQITNPLEDDLQAAVHALPGAAGQLELSSDEV